jgi:hypothetical protein
LAPSCRISFRSQTLTFCYPSLVYLSECSLSSLLFFGISLLVCTWLIEMYNRAILRLTEPLTTRSEVSVRSGMGSVKQDFEQNERNSVRAGLRIAASICFLLGFATFGLAASVNLLSSLE